MQITEFSASADIVGRRVLLSWLVLFEGADTLASAPEVRVRRKLRDFQFPPVATPDPFGVYDSTAFPPAGSSVAELDRGSQSMDGQRQDTVVDSASVAVDGIPVEILRRTRRTTFRPDGTPQSRFEQILDVGGSATGLLPRVTYYYECVPATGLPDVMRAIATPTDLYGSGRALYEALPAIFRRHDVVAASPHQAIGAIPEASPVNGQLRRFLDVFGAGLDHLRSRAEGLRNLHDVDEVDARALPHLASWLGWDLTESDTIPTQRHEIRYAARLYRITGTLPGCLLWAKRLTGWDLRVAEMWRNVLVTNDVGNPDEVGSRGSRTVDTSDAAALATLGRVDDAHSYSYDTQTGPGNRYAFNVIAFFGTPEPGQTVSDVLRLRSRLVNGSTTFLPFNLRAIVVLDVPESAGSSTTSLAVTTSTDPGV